MSLAQVRTFLELGLQHLDNIEKIDGVSSAISDHPTASSVLATARLEVLQGVNRVNSLRNLLVSGTAPVHLGKVVSGVVVGSEEGTFTAAFEVFNGEVSKITLTPD